MVFFLGAFAGTFADRTSEAFKKQRRSWLDGFKTFSYSASDDTAADSFTRTWADADS